MSKVRTSLNDAGITVTELIDTFLHCSCVSGFDNSYLAMFQFGFHHLRPLMPLTASFDKERHAFLLPCQNEVATFCLRVVIMYVRMYQAMVGHVQTGSGWLFYNIIICIYCCFFRDTGTHGLGLLAS